MVLTGHGELVLPGEGPLDWLVEGTHVNVVYEMSVSGSRVVTTVRSVRRAQFCEAIPLKPTRYLAVMQLGRMGVREALTGHLIEHVPHALVRSIWDRRATERRRGQQPAAKEGRQRERRKRPPPTWDTLGFVLTRLAV